MKVGDTVEIVKPYFLIWYPVLLTPEGETPPKTIPDPRTGPADLSHLVGLRCKITGFSPNVFDSSIGRWHLDIPKDKLVGIPNGKIWQGFEEGELKLING